MSSKDIFKTIGITACAAALPLSMIGYWFYQAKQSDKIENMYKQETAQVTFLPNDKVQLKYNDGNDEGEILVVNQAKDNLNCLLCDDAQQRKIGEKVAFFNEDSTKVVIREVDSLDALDRKFYASTFYSMMHRIDTFKVALK